MKTTLLLATLFAATVTQAQNIDKENCGDHPYVQTPIDLSLQGLTNYVVTATVPNNNAYIIEMARTSTNLEGFTKTTSTGMGEFTVNFTIFPLSFTTPQYKQTKHETEKDGVKKVTYTHTYDSKYTYRADVQVLDQSGIEIYQTSVSGTNAITKSSNLSSTAAKQSHDDEVKKVRETTYNGNVSTLNSQLNERFCTMNKTFNLRVVTVKPKKYEYDGFNAAVESLKALVSVTDQAEKNKICEAAIALWEEDLKESNVEDRKARIDKKITAGAYYNIAHAYFVMGEYEKSAANFEKAQEFDNAVTILHGTKLKIAEDMAARKALQAQ